MQRQWQRKQFRLEMLTMTDAWPKQYTIGQPTAAAMTSTPLVVREHVDRWRQRPNGEIIWHEVNYRASSEPIRLPSHWVLSRPSDWISATADRQITADYNLLKFLIDRSEPTLRDPLIVNLKLLQNRSREELVSAVELAARLKPREAQGRPLRLLAGHGVDTKFFERNRKLLITLLDARFNGEVSKAGLHEFLDASPDGEHWLLLKPLQKGLLPFDIQQVRSRELASLNSDVIQANAILVVENRQCWHLLPELDDTVAILGAGLDLDWLRAEWLTGKRIAYWGDIDTWGLTMLAQARQHQSNLSAILMDRQTFDDHSQGNSVIEPLGAGEDPPDLLNDDERSLYQWLLNCKLGRLEQEFLPVEVVHGNLKRWATTFA